MKKKALSLLLALCLLLAFLPVTAQAAETSGTFESGVTWSYSGGTLTIQGTGDMDDYNNGSTPWYDFREQIHTVQIGNGVESIGRSAFEGLINLTNINIPDSVGIIYNYAFYGCSSLSSITLPNHIGYIGMYAFAECSSLTNITIPSSTQ